MRTKRDTHLHNIGQRVERSQRAGNVLLHEASKHVFVALLGTTADHDHAERGFASLPFGGDANESLGDPRGLAEGHDHVVLIDHLHQMLHDAFFVASKTLQISPSRLSHVLQIVHLPLDLLLRVLRLRAAVDAVDHLVDLLVDAFHRHRRRSHRADVLVLPRQRLAQQHRKAPLLRGVAQRVRLFGSGQSGREVVDELLKSEEKEVGAARSSGDLAIAHQEAELDEARMESVCGGVEGVERGEVLRQRSRERGVGGLGEEVVLRERKRERERVRLTGLRRERTAEERGPKKAAERAAGWAGERTGTSSWRAVWRAFGLGWGGKGLWRAV